MCLSRELQVFAMICPERFHNMKFNRSKQLWETFCTLYIPTCYVGGGGGDMGSRGWGGIFRVFLFLVLLYKWRSLAEFSESICCFLLSPVYTLQFLWDRTINSTFWRVLTVQKFSSFTDLHVIDLSNNLNLRKIVTGFRLRKMVQNVDWLYVKVH